jgi:sugar O-acyltransferase (sialic acid O-acetyltransferase NeuD family)
LKTALDQRLLIVGASGHGKVLAECAEACGWQVAFADDRYPDLSSISAGEITWPVVSKVSFTTFKSEGFTNIALAVGNNELRQQWLNEAQVNDLHMPVIIHPSASVSPSATIAQATVIFPLSVVNANAVIGQAVIINSAAVIEHDCKVGSFTHISPKSALAGAVSVGQRCWLGIGSSVIQCLNITDDVTVGAGSVVIESISTAGTYIGVPAKLMERS